MHLKDWLKDTKNLVLNTNGWERQNVQTQTFRKDMSGTILFGPTNFEKIWYHMNRKVWPNEAFSPAKPLRVLESLFKPIFTLAPSSITWANINRINHVLQFDMPSKLNIKILTNSYHKEPLDIALYCTFLLFQMKPSASNMSHWETKSSWFFLVY